MALEWQKHDDSTFHLVLGGVLPVAVIYDRMGNPGWKVMVGKRSLRDKMPSMEDAQKVALVYALKILKQCQKDLDQLMAGMHLELPGQHPEG